MNNRKNTTIFIVGFLAIFSLLTVLVFADSDVPYGVRNINVVTSSRPNLSSYPPANLTDVTAGNVTEVTLYGVSTTKAWAGYYGNITGTITLETSDGYVFYNWTATEPKGEIYASINSSITWANIVCFEFDGSNGNFNVDDAEGWFGIPDDAADGINETFTDNTNLAFQVGTVQILANTCPATNPYENGVPVDGDFENVLLTDQDVLVFTTIIENNEVDNSTDINGFDSRPHDFQLLVAENGYDGFEDTTTTYYFWAEIE
jgi:hypothetical protein